MSNPIPQRVPACAEKILARPEWFSDPRTVANTKLSEANWIARLLSSRTFAGTAIGAITLGRTIYFRDPELYEPHTAQGLAFLAHEIKHVEQFERLGLVGFYAKYIADYFRGGYGREIEYEDEAYEFQQVVSRHLRQEFEDNPGIDICQELDEPHSPNLTFVCTIPDVFIFPPPAGDND
jgi:hypothetical protein